MHVKSRDFLLGDSCKLRLLELGVPILKNVLWHLEVSDVPKSGADYTHVGRNCQPIFTSVKRHQLYSQARNQMICKHQATRIAAAYKLVRKERLELSHQRYQNLNLARLPIPPLSHDVTIQPVPHSLRPYRQVFDTKIQGACVQAPLIWGGRRGSNP